LIPIAPYGRTLLASLAVAGVFACADLGSEPTTGHLEVRYYSGSIGADMMPTIPPVHDRIGCTVDLLIRNSSALELHTQLRVLQAEMRRSGTNARLGTLFFATPWDGILGPFETDTVRLVKHALSDDFLQPACGAAVELDLELGEAEQFVLRLTTPPLTFGCVY
jgi:hypothetical protein